MCHNGQAGRPCPYDGCKMSDYELNCFEKNALKKGVFRTLVRFGFRVYASLILGLWGSTKFLKFSF